MSWYENKCIVVVHGSLAAYQRAIGSSRDRSVGLATYQIEKKKIVSRRIDVRSDADDWSLAALPHELTHIVLADALQGRPLPQWANEGIAVLSESAAKQARRVVELERAVSNRATIHTAELLALDGPPAAHQRDLFYSQSASLVAYLTSLETPDKFLEFVQLSQLHGASAALRKVYRIENPGQLDALWKTELASGRSFNQFVVDK